MKGRRSPAVRAMVLALAMAAAASVGPASAAFTDVEPGAWYADAVDWLVGEGLTTGVGPGCFDPDGALTRGQAAVFLHRLAGTPPPTEPLRFVDVTAHWQLDAVAWLAAEGITTGVAPLRFAPGAPVTRGQFAALLHRHAGRPAAPRHGFVDVVAPWQHDAVSWLAAAGITTGTAPGRFSPNAAVTRAQLATFLHRHAGLPPAAPAGDADPPTPCRHPLVIHGTGDVNFDPGYGPNPEHDFGYAWSGLDGLFVLDDLTIVNLECAPSTLGSPVPKRFNFRCPPESLGATREAGVDVVNLANNHGGDFGIGALLDGAANAVGAGVIPVGAGVDLAQATSPALIEENGWTIAVLGFNTISANPEWRAGPGRPGMAPGDIETMTAAVRAADQVADLVFVTIHWGIEGTFTPAADDLPRAYALIEAGADAIFGHHPHRLQPLTYHEGRPIFWSLGNFVWQSQQRSRATAVGRVEVAADGSITASLLPADIADKGHPVLLG